jgi:hypothetical protein
MLALATSSKVNELIDKVAELEERLSAQTKSKRTNKVAGAGSKPK